MAHTSEAAPLGQGAGPLAGARKALDIMLEALAVALLLAALGVSFFQVVLRYLFGAALPWPEEVACWCFGWAVMLGMALATGRGAHITVDLVARALPAAVRPAHAAFVRTVMVAASAALLVHGIAYIGKVYQFSPALQWKMSWFFLAVPVGAALNIVFLAWPRAGERLTTCLLSVVAGALLYVAIRYGAPEVFTTRAIASVLVIIGIALIALGVPIAFALIGATFAAFSPANPLLLVTLPQNIGAALNSFTLLAIPFFIMAAAVMNAGGITPRLVELAGTLVGHLRSGLGQVNILTNVMLAGISGSSTADASTVAKLLVPEMAKRGYDRPFGAALTAASSTIANLIPPGLGLIIYAALASVSVGALFVATIVPGLMVAAALMIVTYAISRRRGFGGDMERASGRARLKAFLVAVPALVLPLVIVGGVRFGAFTATEAGTVAFVYALLCGALLYRRLTGSSLLEAVREGMLDTVVILTIIAAAAPFAWVLAFERVPQTIAATLSGLVEQPFLLLLAINALLLVVGLFMEMIAALVILVPILVPIVVAAGVDPVHFGIVIVMNLVLGALTPPLGVLVFTTARVGQADLVATFRAVVPFVAVLILVLFLVTYLPALTLVPVQFLGP